MMKPVKGHLPADARYFVGAACILAFTASCARPVPQDLRPVEVLAMPEHDYVAHRYTDQSNFREGEGIVLLGDVTWPEPGVYGGVHETDWQLFRDGKLLNEKISDERLETKPADIVAHIGADSFPPGAYHAVLVVDKSPLTSKDFRISAAQLPALLAGKIGGADCKVVPDPKAASRPKVPVVHLVWAKFPDAAQDKNVDGCAVVSTVVDADGRAAGVRVELENPPGYGFGTAAADAAWATVYASGHGGETVVRVNYFKAPR